MTERKSSFAPLVACLLMLAAFSLMSYVGGYFLLTMGPADTNALGDPIRIYRYRWLAYAFYPAAYVEGRATGPRVLLAGGDGETLRP